MSFLKRLFGPGKADESPDNEVTFARYSLHPVHAATGQERQTYIQEVAVVLGRPAETLELSSSLLNEYGCDDMEVSECVQIAEQIWSVSLMPNPMKESDYAIC